MAHQIYQTEGIILKKKNFGEADCFFYVLTKKFGMINAVAKSARLEKSKLRYGLGLFSYSGFALISSKNFRQIVDAKEIKTAPLSAHGDRTCDIWFEKAPIFAALANFLIKMLKGEEKNYFIWREIKNFLFTLHNSGVEKEKLKKIRVQTTARILNNLGYMENLPSVERHLISAINKAIKESML